MNEDRAEDGPRVRVVVDHKDRSHVLVCGRRRSFVPGHGSSDGQADTGTTRRRSRGRTCHIHPLLVASGTWQQPEGLWLGRVYYSCVSRSRNVTPAPIRVANHPPLCLGSFVARSNLLHRKMFHSGLPMDAGRHHRITRCRSCLLAEEALACAWWSARSRISARSCRRRGVQGSAHRGARNIRGSRLTGCSAPDLSPRADIPVTPPARRWRIVQKLSAIRKGWYGGTDTLAGGYTPRPDSK
jgi:hypothetical protein